MAPPRRPWFRFYVEAIHDRKLRRLPPSQRWLWVVVLSVARSSSRPPYLVENGGVGVTPLGDVDLADLAALPVKDVRAGIKAFVEAGMLTHDPEVGAVFVTKWEERQFESDDIALRTAKHRSKPHDGTTMERSIVHDGTTMERRCNGDVTPPDTEPDTDTEPTPLPPGGGGGSLPNVNPNVNRAIELLVDAEQAKAGTLTNPTGWRRTVHRRLTTERTADLEHLADQHPDWTPEQLVATNGHRPQVFHQADLEPVDHAKALQNLRAAREATGQ